MRFSNCYVRIAIGANLGVTKGKEYSWGFSREEGVLNGK